MPGLGAAEYVSLQNPMRMCQYWKAVCLSSLWMHALSTLADVTDYLLRGVKGCLPSYHSLVSHMASLLLLQASVCDPCADSAGSSQHACCWTGYV